MTLLILTRSFRKGVFRRNRLYWHWHQTQNNRQNMHTNRRTVSEQPMVCDSQLTYGGFPFHGRNYHHHHRHPRISSRRKFWTKLQCRWSPGEILWGNILSEGMSGFGLFGMTFSRDNFSREKSPWERPGELSGWVSVVFPCTILSLYV